jgi:HEPN domain-containing protein
MSVELLIANLLRVAAEDLAGARLLATTSNRNAIYLCEQAAEKIIRAVVTSEGARAGIKHQLDEMVDLVPDENPLKPALRAIEHLTAYATAYRYPTSAGRIVQPPKGQAFADDAAKVELALRDAASRFGADLTTQGTPAAHRGPIR